MADNQSVFPANFLWGAATSSHQVEGGNSLNDWWLWEHNGYAPHRSGHACKHYEMFQGDFDLAQALQHTAHRFSIEWSRVEPQENRWDENELEHYKDVISALRKRGMEPVVTLHHFTNPVWFTKKFGWLNNDAPSYFSRYVSKVVSALRDSVRYWITINEPMVLVYYAYILGIWPPGQRSESEARKAIRNLIVAHKMAYLTIHDTFSHNAWGKPLVSIAKNMQVFSACKYFPYFLNALPAFARNKLFNEYFISQIRGYLDFIGINYYSRRFVRFSLRKTGLVFGEECNAAHRHGKKTNALGWVSYPEGLLHIVRKMKRYGLPLMITENGTCVSDDRDRWNYIASHINQIERALHLQIPMIGYFYWSLLDNFEWDKGFEPRFGLIDVDYHTFKRTVRESAVQYGKLIEEKRKRA